jgi:hypothetical protein
MSTNKHRLPIGIQTFAKIREKLAYYYVDKTPHIQALIDQGTHFFLSRPRRFGKSLLVDTLKELFEGNRSLFQGLYIEDRWDWSVTYPVIHISFGKGVLKSAAELEVRIKDILQVNQQRLGISCLDSEDAAGCLSEMIRNAHEKYGQRVVILVDEYDKPILDNITDSQTAIAMREGLKNIYSVIKDSDADIQFVFLTGVSKFSKVSLFSGLNNLTDITLDKRYATICGYTDADVDTVFAAELPGLDREEIRRWYNGYNWLGEGVYNPFDLLLLFDKREWQSYWFETATPTFLVKLLAERGMNTPRLTRLQTSANLLGRFDVDDIATEALLFQTGYLTIHRVDEPLPGQKIFTLGYPNREVESCLNEALLPAFGLDAQRALENRLHLLTALKANDFQAMHSHLRALYASLPHDWYRNNPIAKYEGHYASIFYSHLAAFGLDVKVEDASNSGKVDLVFEFNNQFYLFEFKVVEQVPQGKAVEQLKTKGYADKYRANGKPIYLIGVEFSKDQRQIVAFDVENA